MPQTQPLIRIRGLKKSFGDHAVLQGVDIDIDKGQSVVIIGQSGGGKSVLLKTILGLIEADAGSIEIEGQDIETMSQSQLASIRDHIGMLFQGGALFDSLPVWRNITFAITQGHLRDTAKMQKLASEYLARVGLDDRILNLRSGELSGGMQKRVAIARAIAAKPEILLFDEPTAGLDPIRSDVIDDLTLSLVRDNGMTAITITHDMASVCKIADKIAFLHEGRIIWTGNTQDLRTTDNPYVRQFFDRKAEGPLH
ncbi:ABC transporter related protein [Zymomonas mobilis subsp. mobilis ZM4 = ATCC 31821]|uniref:ABC transporter related protein n=1 Tax=Zymomonas mobilis subsp. mobilis (strain ATCC 31821 / ZM4 / CP4) TaxID=264203 RepID=Q5NM46_ZYMMO|nr:ATP-binding cassette domain-containing protein [Zymomonas mobilis]AAV90214.1 ABC transporter related protein [Zymomonas mobilis subsp. mobilis ZM4 = ATCC 31821]ACV76157.1 ABC transporter related [Zymomonas mobilis subsp. mobilis NCIMB 11163]AHB10844.1 ABC-type transport system involved in resistance to organic solvents, ATPase component [Zymomonas mobilis subsp. mobilis str. CP4 = NRRL B-14023]AHJ71155.1 Glutamine transport ATP-binding protein GlnQ [Zymomonas mobilis subsp. mobilis NRRL B-12